MRRSHARKTKRRGGPSRGSARSTNGNDKTVRARFVINPFDLYMVVTYLGGIGGIGSGADGTTLPTGSSNIDLSPSTMLGRFNIFASLFQQYRILRLRIQFKTALGSDGMIAGGNVTMTPAYINRTFAFGCYPDPFLFPTDYSDAINFGATVTSVRNNATFNYRPSRDWMNGWRYVIFGGGSDVSDLRSYSIGNFFAIYAEPSLATVANAMGNFIFTMDAEFRWPVAGNLAPRPMPPASRLQEESTTPQSDGELVGETVDEMKLEEHRQQWKQFKVNNARLEKKMSVKSSSVHDLLLVPASDRSVTSKVPPSPVK